MSVDTMPRLFVGWIFVAVIRDMEFGVDTKKGGRRSGRRLEPCFSASM